MRRSLLTTVFLILASVFSSCKKDNSIVAPPTEEYPNGKIYFQPTAESGLSPGLWMIELGATDTTLRLVVPNLWYSRISYDETRIVGLEVVNHTALITTFSPTGNYFNSFGLDSWSHVQFIDPSPSGEKIVVSTAQFVAGSPAVCLINSDGTGFRILNDTTRGSDGWPIPAMVPTWSPDGSKIAYLRLYSYTDSTQAILTVVSPDGTISRDLFQSYRLSVPLWSPNGQMIACFQEPRTIFEPEPFAVRIVDVGSGTSKHVVLVSSTPDPDYKSMAWSIDGTLFCSGASRDSEGVHSIYRISVADPPIVTKVADGFTRSTLICSPDGKYIAILGNKGKDGYSLYIMRPDGSDLRLVKKLSSNLDGLAFGFRYGFWISN